MNITVVNHGLPHPNLNGGPMTVWAIFDYLVKTGHKVQIICIRYSNDHSFTQDRLSLLDSLGASVKIIDCTSITSNPFFSFKLPSFFSTTTIKKEISKLIANFDTNVTFAYHWDSAVACFASKPPIVCGVGDPWHLPSFRRWQNSNIISRIIRPHSCYLNLKNYFVFKHIHRCIYDRCFSFGTFQAHETKKFIQMGFNNCKYFRTSIIDTVGNDFSSLRKTSRNRIKTPTILIGPSNLEASSTSIGLIYFSKHIWPNLLPLLKDFDFQVRIVGEGVPPKELLKISYDDRIKIVGRIEPPDTELLSCSLQLVPTPKVLGVRVRIVTAMSFGVPIIAHRCESLNIPELKHGENCLLGSSGKILAKQIADLLQNNDLQEQLSRASRNTYVKFFKPEAAVSAIYDEIMHAFKH